MTTSQRVAFDRAVYSRMASGKTKAIIEPKRTARASASVKAGDMLVRERIDRGILMLRGERVIVDADLASLYGVTTKALNQAVKRNAKRFPKDFMFRLTRAEKQEVVTNCDHLASLKFSPNMPLAFTEHGAMMAASVLNSDRAVEVSLQIIRAFVRVRQLLAEHKDLAQRLAQLEASSSARFQHIYETLQLLMDEPEDEAESGKPKIGFRG